MDDKSVMQKKTILQRATVGVALVAMLTVLVCMFFVGLEGQKSVFYYFNDSILETKANNWDEYWSFLDKSTDLVNACKSLDITYMVATCGISVVMLLGVAIFAGFAIFFFVRDFKKQEFGKCILFAMIAVIVYCTCAVGLYAMENMAITLPLMGTDTVAMNAMTVVGLIVGCVAVLAIIGSKVYETLGFEHTRARAVKTLCAVSCLVATLATFLFTALTTVEAKVNGAVYKGSPFTFTFLTVAGFGDRVSDLSKSMELKAQFAQIFFGLVLIFSVLGWVRQSQNLMRIGKHKSGICWAVLATLCALLAWLFTASVASSAEKLVGSGCTATSVFPVLAFLFSAINWVVTYLCKKRCEKERVKFLDR